MGQGGYLTLVNSTIYDWHLNGIHSYQMNSWAFPQTISAYTSVRVYVEFNQHIFHNSDDDAGEAHFQLVGTEWKFQVQVRADPFRLQIFQENLETNTHPKGSTIGLGWKHDGTIVYTLAGADGDFSTVTSFDKPHNWMQDHLKLLGDRTLREVCIPGSHDSGMSCHGSHTAFGYECNTRTQCVDVGTQLSLGVRYFDIRPVISGGGFYTGHYSDTDTFVGWQGANGQSIPSLIDQINAYTDGNEELIILNLSHDTNTDTDYKSFTKEEWDKLLPMLIGIKHLYVDANPTTVELTKLKLNQFIGNGNAAVVLVIRPGKSFDLGAFVNKGIYLGSNFPIYDVYSNANEASTMSSDQIEKMNNHKASPNDSYFILSWILTQSDYQAVTCSTSILELAKEANKIIGNIPNSCTPECYPSVLYVDGIESLEFLVLAQTLNFLAAKP